MFFLCVSAWCPRNDTVHTRVPHQEEDKHTSPVDTHFLSLHSVMQICVYTFRYHSNQTVTTTGKLNVYSVQHKQMKPALFISHWKISKNNVILTLLTLQLFNTNTIFSRYCYNPAAHQVMSHGSRWADSLSQISYCTTS